MHITSHHPFYLLLSSHRYMAADDADIIFPFGHGLSYTTFHAAFHATTQPSTLDNAKDDTSVTFTVALQNTGAAAGRETLLAYWKPAATTSKAASTTMPLQRRLFAFAKAGPLAPGAMETVQLTLTVEALALADAKGALVSTPQAYDIIISRGDRTDEISTRLTLTGNVRTIDEALPTGLAPQST